MPRKRDVESGAVEGGGGGGGERPLYPMMLESPQLRWSFIRKVYSIITFQLLVTVAVAAVVVFVRPIAHFFVGSIPGLVLYIVLILVPFISTLCLIFFLFACTFCYYYLQMFICFYIISFYYVAALCPLYYYHKKHPLNYFLLFIFTVTLAFAIGLTCAFTSGKLLKKYLSSPSSLFFTFYHFHNDNLFIFHLLFVLFGLNLGWISQHMNRICFICTFAYDFWQWWKKKVHVV